MTCTGCGRRDMVCARLEWEGAISEPLCILCRCDVREVWREVSNLGRIWLAA